jgi:hypothetical protein
LPPLSAGAVYVTFAPVVPFAYAVPIVGAPGTTNIGVEGVQTVAGPVPKEFVAVTLNV